MSTSEFKEVLPKTGLLHHEATYNFVLCKPKIMPLKSITLEKLEKMQKEAQELVRDQVCVSETAPCTSCVIEFEGCDTLD